MSLAARIRRLVDDVHDGSLLEASAHAGVPYATLREIHVGRVDPNPALLERLARAYRLPLSWFEDGSESDDGTLPLAGWAGFLPDPGAPPDRLGRRFTIPSEAWPLIRVLVNLEKRLRDLPVSADRPIVGAATDPREIRQRITAFIFQPLVAARSIGGTALGWADGREVGSDEQWVSMLSDLGRFWERALGGLVPELAGLSSPFARTA